MEKSFQTFFDSNIEFDVLMISYKLNQGEPVEEFPFIKKVTDAQTSSGYIVNQHYYDTLINLIDHDRDKLIDIFGIKTLQRSYLLKDKNNVPLESPQMMFLRCAVHILIEIFIVI